MRRSCDHRAERWSQRSRSLEGGFFDRAGTSILLIRPAVWSALLPRFPWCLGVVVPKLFSSPKCLKTQSPNLRRHGLCRPIVVIENATKALKPPNRTRTRVLPDRRSIRCRDFDGFRFASSFGLFVCVSSKRSTCPSRISCVTISSSTWTSARRLVHEAGTLRARTAMTPSLSPGAGSPGARLGDLGAAVRRSTFGRSARSASAESCWGSPASPPRASTPVRGVPPAPRDVAADHRPCGADGGPVAPSARGSPRGGGNHVALFSLEPAKHARQQHLQRNHASTLTPTSRAQFSDSSDSTGTNSDGSRGSASSAPALPQIPSETVTPKQRCDGGH